MLIVALTIIYYHSAEYNNKCRRVSQRCNGQRSAVLVRFGDPTLCRGILNVSKNVFKRPLTIQHALGLPVTNWRIRYRGLKPVHTVAEKCDNLSQKSETVAQNGETTAKFGDCRTKRQSHFCATASLFCDSVDRALGCIQTDTSTISVWVIVNRSLHYSSSSRSHKYEFCTSTICTDTGRFCAGPAFR